MAVAWRTVLADWIGSDTQYFPYQPDVPADAAYVGVGAGCGCGEAHLDGGPPIAMATARRLGCDASVVTITEDSDGNVLDVGRRTRGIPPPIARALRRRDGGYRFPGCGALNHLRRTSG